MRDNQIAARSAPNDAFQGAHGSTVDFPITLASTAKRLVRPTKGRHGIADGRVGKGHPRQGAGVHLAPVRVGLDCAPQGGGDDFGSFSSPSEGARDNAVEGCLALHEVLRTSAYLSPTLLGQRGVVVAFMDTLVVCAGTSV